MNCGVDSVLAQASKVPFSPPQPKYGSGRSSGLDHQIGAGIACDRLLSRRGCPLESIKGQRLEHVSQIVVTLSKGRTHTYPSRGLAISSIDLYTVHRKVDVQMGVMPKQ